MKKLITLLLLTVTSVLWAQNEYQKDLFTPEVVMKYRSKIKLSQKQASNIKKIHSDLASNFSDLKWDLGTEKEALNDLLKASKVNKKQTLAQMDKVTNLENQLKKLQLEMLVNVKNELTEDQQKQLKELRTLSDLKPLSIVTPINNDGQKIKFQVSKNTSTKDNPIFIIKERGKEREEDKFYLEKIDPDKIESVKVLKGKSATVLYGKRGENGVVEIKLKENK